MRPVPPYFPAEQEHFIFAVIVCVEDENILDLYILWRSPETESLSDNGHLPAAQKNLTAIPLILQAAGLPANPVGQKGPVKPAAP